MVSLKFKIPDYASYLAGNLAFGFGAGVRRQIVLTLANAHVKAVEDEAKANAPSESGQLRASISAYFAGRNLGVLEATAPHAKYLHEGTGIYGPKRRPIVIEPKGKKALNWPGAKHPVKRVRQRGIKPSDFLRMAMAQSRAEARVRQIMKSLVMNQAANAAASSAPGSFVNAPSDFSNQSGSNFFTMSPGMIELDLKMTEGAKWIGFSEPKIRKGKWRRIRIIPPEDNIAAGLHRGEIKCQYGRHVWASQEGYWKYTGGLTSGTVYRTWDLPHEYIWTRGMAIPAESFVWQIQCDLPREPYE
jgi:hypothetical protein